MSKTSQNRLRGFKNQINCAAWVSQRDQIVCNESSSTIRPGHLQLE